MKRLFFVALNRALFIVLSLRSLGIRAIATPALVLACMAFLSSGTASAQDAVLNEKLDQLIRINELIVKRFDNLEARVAKLEAGGGHPSYSPPTYTPTYYPPPAPAYSPPSYSPPSYGGDTRYVSYTPSYSGSDYRWPGPSGGSIPAATVGQPQYRKLICIEVP